MVQPAPFEIAPLPDGGQVATNGAASLTLLDLGGRVFRRRAIKATTKAPAALEALPLVNELAGQLLAAQDMPADQVQARLAEISARIAPAAHQKIEWAVAEIGGVRVYFDGANVIVTTQDLAP